MPITSEQAKAKWQDPKYRKRQMAIRADSAFKKRNAAILKAARPALTSERARAMQAIQMQDPAYRKRMRRMSRERSQEQWRDPAHREAVSAANKRTWQDPAYRKRRSKTSKTLWQDPAYRKRALVSLVKARAQTNHLARTHTPTRFELAVAAALPFRVQHQKQIDRYTVDLYHARTRLVIECDSDYWHSLPNVRRRDRKRDRVLRSLGYQVIRIRQSMFKKNPTAAIAAALRKAGVQ